MSHYINISFYNMNKGGRPQKPVWDFFNKVTVHGILKAECKMCFVRLANKAARLLIHKNKCLGILGNIIDKRPEKVTNTNEISDIMDISNNDVSILYIYNHVNFKLGLFK